MSFTSWADYLEFKKSIIGTSRYFLEQEALSFLKKLIDASDKRKKVIPKGKSFFRAQQGYDEVRVPSSGSDTVIVKTPYAKHRMKPATKYSKGGRANPAGVSYLYLATDHETALAEMRPWLGAEFSSAEFISNRELIVADFITNSENASYLPKQISAEHIEETIFYHVNNAFSEPVTQEESAISYVPTQIISEYFKSNDYDGIAYKSSLGSGYNLVIFDVNSFDAVNCQIFRAEKVQWGFASSTKIIYD